VRVPVHLRRRGGKATGGRTRQRPDISKSREHLQRRRQREEERRARAVQAFRGATGTQALSELGWLDADAFCIFLELLDAALTGERRSDGTRVGETEDGHIRILLRPLSDSGPVAIETSEGRFTTPQDAEITIEVNR